METMETIISDNNQGRRRALGRGLEELFSNNEPMDFAELEKKIVDEANKDEIVDIKLSDLRSNPYQPRQVFDEEKLKELAESIKEYGVIQPIIVKKSIKGYEIIAGERRVKASILAGNETIPAIIRDFDDADMMQIALLENLQRENLNILEEAEAYKNIIEKLKITHEELGKRLGKSRSHITNIIGLLALPEMVKTLVVQGKISMGHARVLSKITNEELVLTLANRIINENLTVREIEDLATAVDYKRTSTHQKQEKNTEYKYVEESLFDKFGTKVKIKNKKIVINFENDNDLNRILEIIGINN